MRIAIDIDGTIDTSKYLPELLEHNEVYFLTTRRKTKEEREKQLQDLGIANYRDIVIVEGSVPNWIAWNKAIWIKENNIDVVFDNDVYNVSVIKQECPDVEVFLFV